MRLVLLLIGISYVQSLLFQLPYQLPFQLKTNDFKYPLSRRYHNDYLERIKNNEIKQIDYKKYPHSRNYHESVLRKLNSKNCTEQNKAILNNNGTDADTDVGTDVDADDICDTDEGDSGAT